MANIKKISLWIAGVFGVLLILLIAVIMALPLIMDLEQVRDRVRGTLSSAIGGEVEFKTFQVSLFPPGGEVSGLRFQRPGLSGSADSIHGDISIPPLFQGNLEIDSVTVREPDFSLEIAEPDWISGSKESRPWTPGRVRGRISEALSKIDPSLRDASLKVQKGAIVIKQQGKPDCSFQDVNLSMTLPGEELAIELTAKSNVFEFLDFSGSINRDGSGAGGEFAVRELRPGQVSRLFEQNATRAFEKAEVSLRFDFESKASDTIQGSLKGSVVSGKIPYPLQVAAFVVFNEDGLSVQDADVRSERSYLKASSARLSLKGEKILQIGSAAAEIDLDRTHAWVVPLISQIEKIRDRLPEYKDLAGTLSLSSLNVKGPLRRPGEWEFQGQGAAYDLVLEAADLPSPFKLKTGQFEGSGKRVTGRLEGVDLLGSSLSISGNARDLGQGFSSLELNFSGPLSGKTMGWLKDKKLIPAWVKAETRVSVSKGRLAWGRERQTVVEADSTLEEGPELTLHIVHSPKQFNIEKLTINDSESRAAMQGTVGRDIVDLEFQGKLTAGTASKLIVRQNMVGWINGDFNLHVSLQDPGQSRVLGALQAGGFAYENGLERPLQVKDVSIQGEKDRILIQSADLAWGETPVGVKGTLVFSGKGIDLDLVAETGGLDWENISRLADVEGLHGKAPGKGEAEGALELFKDLEVAGKMLVKADHFTYKELTWKPFHVSLERRDEGLQARLTRGSLCGIRTEAVADVSSGNMQIEAEAAASGQPLASTLNCFLKTELMTGEFDLTAQMASSGKPQDLLDRLQGNFTINAADGRIYKFGLLADILAVVNITEILKGQSPDLAGEGFGYKTAEVRGIVEKGILRLTECYVIGKSIDLAFRGEVDLPEKKLDVLVLVTPLKTVDSIIGSIPILGDILGKNFIAIPVRVRGDLSDPEVMPVSPSAVGKGVLGILERTLKLPVKIVQPFLPDKQEQ
ncbi:MAG: AsmA-like C-terminal domain-containing protein [Desulfohalobiaceae bacterium]|nr:AsmA-like C-terminal domain-containing protein [Desulfohalobiaceae bacterium]